MVLPRLFGKKHNRTCIPGLRIAAGSGIPPRSSQSVRKANQFPLEYRIFRQGIFGFLLIALICGFLVSADDALTGYPGNSAQPSDPGRSPALGHVVWNFTTENTISSSPAVAGGNVYIGSEDGYLYALHADSGDLVWKYRTGSYITSSPEIADGVLYIGGGDRVLYAIRADTGIPVWTYRAGAGISSSPAINEGTLYFSSEDGNLTSLDASTGTFLWSYPTGSFLHSSPAVAGGYVYFGSYDHAVYALNATNGALEWRFPTGDTVLSSPAVRDGRVYIGSNDRNVYALDAGTGNVVWNFATGGPVASSPTVFEGRVYIGSSDGNVYCLDAGTGALFWSYKTGNSIDSTPLVAEGIVYLGSGDGTFYALNATSGYPVWEYPVGDALYSSPAIDNRVIFIGSTNHRIYALSNRPPVADFTVDATGGNTPFTVRFTDHSSGTPTAWLWDFGDGDGTNATMQNPVHTYTREGSFTVNLTVTNGGGSAVGTREGYIATTTILPPLPVADFTVGTTLGIAPLTVRFIDRSTGAISSWHWDFGDGNTSSRMNPWYTYPDPGNFTVTLTVENPNGSSRMVLSTPITVRANAILPDPDFSVNTSSGLPPLAVQFNDTSLGPDITEWAWDFNNDGIIDSSEQNVTCIYRQPGNYTVNLTVTNPYGTRTLSRTGLILVGSLAPVVSFTADNLTGLPPLTVRFNDTSRGSNTTGWAWDFNNDGIIDSTDPDPVCVYKLPGNYTVSLTATNAYGSNSTTRAGFIQVGSFIPRVSFIADNVTGLPPMTVRFNDTTPDPGITGWAWDFNGDGVIDSTDRDPSCVYKIPGNYTVNLTVTNPYGSNTSSRAGFIWVTSGILPNFTASDTWGTAPFTVRFADRSGGREITGWAWDFNGDGVIDSTERNPSCVYKLPGNYTVSLTVTNKYGSETAFRTGYILVGSPGPEVNFSAENATGVPPFTVRFHDTTPGSDLISRAWDFNGDGTIDSTEQNPSCVYREYGNYTVSLTVTNSSGSATVSKPDFIRVSSGIPTARFAVNRTSGTGPLSVRFRDMSTGANATGWAWDFNGDGLTDSTDQSPVCIYRLPGVYTIRYTVSNAYGSDTIVRDGFITVT